jgi:hypothetical protein
MCSGLPGDRATTVLVRGGGVDVTDGRTSVPVPLCECVHECLT